MKLFLLFAISIARDFQSVSAEIEFHTPNSSNSTAVHRRAQSVVRFPVKLILGRENETIFHGKLLSGCQRPVLETVELRRGSRFERSPT
jgi:hypothetical protein